MTELDWNKIVDDIRASEQAQEWDGDKIGLGEYYFSEHSKNLDILDQFDWEEEFFKQHPELKAYLDNELRDWWEDQIHDKILAKEYRKRITEIHKCSECGKEISEAYPWGHDKHLYRLGVERIEGTDKWTHGLF